MLDCWIIFTIIVYKCLATSKITVEYKKLMFMIVITKLYYTMVTGNYGHTVIVIMQQLLVCNNFASNL